MVPAIQLAKIFRLGSPYKLVSSLRCTFESSTWMMNWADRVISVSSAVADTADEMKISRQKIRVVLNGPLNTVRAQSAEKYAQENLYRPNITSVCGMSKRKGVQDLISAFGKVALKNHEVHLYLVGDGPEHQLFEQQVKSMNCAERIHFEGFQSFPQRYLNASDIFVLASHRDPFPRVLCEAREAGCAVVGSEVDGIPEALDKGEAGILFPVGDVPALANILEELLNDSEKLESWKSSAIKNLQNLSVKRVHQETLEVYNELLDVNISDRTRG